MSLPSSPSPLPKWPFVLADLAFLAAAGFIGYSAPQPLAPSAIYAIVACVLAAAIAGCVPFIVEYARRQEEAVDDRQRSLEALARTVTTAAEQIGIAAGGFHEIAELAQRNLKDAEALPAKVAAKFGEIEGKIDAAREDDREELERELATLRASESERLEATVQKIAKAAAEWSKAESTGLRHVVAAKTFIAELEAKTAALKSIAAGLPAVPASSSTEAKTELGQEERAPKSKRSAAAVSTPPVPIPSAEEDVLENGAPAAPSSAPTVAAQSLESAESKVEPVAAGEQEAGTPADSSARQTNGASDAQVAAEPKPARKPRAPKAPAAVAEKPMAEPINTGGASLPSPHADVSGEADVPLTPAAAAFTDEIEPEAPAASPEPVPRKKPAARKPSVELEPTLGLDIPDENEERTPPASLSSDGATRLLVTAYIGIGNRLFIRGEGPGLSWDEGVPLQFVSIGKWRWETPSAAAPVRFKLYKNDREECALGLDLLEPGKQQELTV